MIRKIVRTIKLNFKSIVKRANLAVMARIKARLLKFKKKIQGYLSQRCIILVDLTKASFIEKDLDRIPLVKANALDIRFNKYRMLTDD